VRRLLRALFSPALLVALSALPPAVHAGAATPSSSVYSAGSAVVSGSTGDLLLNGPLVDIVASATGRGYWQLGSDGGVFSFGDAPFYGSTGNIRLTRPVLSMSPTRSGGGYWFVASDGGVFAFGDAGFFGSTGNMVLNRPVVGMAPTRTGKGYLLVASDGGVFAFGDAAFSGSLGSHKLDHPIVGLAPLPSGDGYWLLDSVGSVFPFGAARSYGYVVSDTPMVDLAATPTGRGYWLMNADGEVEAFGDAAQLQPPVTLGPGQRAVGLASTPDGRGLWVATSGRYVPNAATAQGTHAFLFHDSLNRPGRWNPCASITWVLNPAAAPAGAQQLLVDAFDHVGSITGLTFRYGGTTSAAPNADTPGTIVVGWVRGLGSDGRATPSGILTPRAPRITAAAIEFNVDRPHPMTFGNWGWGPVVLHEIGHALGLDHVTDAAQLMYPVHQAGSPSTFASGDLAGLYRVGAAGGCL
jgi:Matrixin